MQSTDSTKSLLGEIIEAMTTHNSNQNNSRSETEMADMSGEIVEADDEVVIEGDFFDHEPSKTEKLDVSEQVELEHRLETSSRKPLRRC